MDVIKPFKLISSPFRVGSVFVFSLNKTTEFSSRFFVNDKNIVFSSFSVPLAANIDSLSQNRFTKTQRAILRQREKRNEILRTEAGSLRSWISSQLDLSAGSLAGIHSSLIFSLHSTPL
ncbi:unnamed protein product [Arabidopsis lyrata]|nr:unnamed protein product [Arabidopsis lyrata]